MLSRVVRPLSQAWKAHRSIVRCNRAQQHTHAAIQGPAPLGNDGGMFIPPVQAERAHGERQPPSAPSARRPQIPRQIKELNPSVMMPGPALKFAQKFYVHETPLPGRVETRRPHEVNVKDGVLSIRNRISGKWTAVSGRWLRDVCPKSRHPDTAQREINVFKANPRAVKLAKVDMARWPESLEVEFEDGHATTIPAATIQNRFYELTPVRRAGIVEVKTWGSEIESDPPSVPYSDIITGSGMAALLLKIRQYGFAFVSDMPATPEASQSLLDSIGPIRTTHYGGFYDFTSDLSSKDTAYTSEALEPHTDNTYFTEPAGLQALHMLSHTDGSGGESSLVDGFGAAAQLYEQDKEAYKMLSTAGVYAHASGNEGISIQPSQPFLTFTHSPDYHKLMCVRWNNADRAGVAVPWPKLDAWYDAAAKFDALLSDRKNQYWFRLQPGRMLLFDNWRVLHGRAAFTGKRRMCGGYINRDDWVSRFRMTNLTPEEIQGSTVTG